MFQGFGSVHSGWRVPSAVRDTSKCLNSPLFLYRTAKSQSLLDREMGGRAVCMSLVTRCAIV